MKIVKNMIIFWKIFFHISDKRGQLRTLCTFNSFITVILSFPESDIIDFTYYDVFVVDLCLMKL